MLKGFWNSLWQVTPEPEQVAVATRSPVKLKQRAQLPLRRSKRERCDTFCPPDLMNEGTARMTSVHTAVIEEFPETGQLRICFPQKRRRGSQEWRFEEYEWIQSEDDLHTTIALKGYASGKGANLLTLAMEAPALFWNAVWHYDGDLERMERELFVVL